MTALKVQDNKKDFIDEQAICDVACRQSLRFVRPGNSSPQSVPARRRALVGLDHTASLVRPPDA